MTLRMLKKRGRVPLALALLLLWIPACSPQPAAPLLPTPSPRPTFDIGYELIPRTTPLPITPLPTSTPGGNSTVSFSSDIRPILYRSCVGCHGGISGLWLTEYEHVMIGGISGPTVDPGQPESSPLYTYIELGLMPADATPLPDVEMELIRRWIAEGAPNN